jgi:hypothetical protein
MLPLVLRAANLLQVDELEIFRLAYRFWNRHCDETSYIGKAFKQYLHEKAAPPWVTHFARRVVQAYNRGNFDPATFGVYPTYEKLPLTWALALQTPRYVQLNKDCNVFVA